MPAVRLYSAIAVGLKPDGIPDNWPAETWELGEETLPSDAVMMTNEELTDHKATHQATYNAWTNSFYSDPLATQKAVSASISRAIDFGKLVMIEYATTNVLTGKTITEVGTIALALKDIQQVLSSGSLYVAIQMIDTFTPTALITQENLTTFSNKLRTYVGMPQI